MSLLVDDDDNDPIIKEIPIFLSQKASEDIFLLQYPIRTANRSLEQDEHDLGQVRDVQYDPISDKLSLKYYLNTDSNNYMNETGDSELMHMTFTSKLVKQISNYCIGIMHNNELHINPIQSIFQMRPDFSHCNPNMVDNNNNKSDDDSKTITKIDHNMVNCQIIHDLDNDDLYYNEQNGHQTRQFIKNKQEFLNKCFKNENNNTVFNKFANKNKKKVEAKYDSFMDIPPGITKNDALKLPLNQSVCYYLRECIVLKPSQIFIQLNCQTQNKQLKAMGMLLNFGYLIHGRFILKHKYLRNSSLKYYKNEWNMLIALLLKNNSQLTRADFFLNVGEDNIEYEIVDKMLRLLCFPVKLGSRKVIWYLKHDNKDSKMIASQFFDVYNKANENIKQLTSKISIKIDDEFSDIVSRQDDKKVGKLQENKDIDGDIKMDNDKQEMDDIEHDPRQSVKYLACKKFLIQKLKKQRVLLRTSFIKLLDKYGKSYDVLAEIPNEILDMVRDDFCWIIRDEKYCLKEIDEFKDMKEYNEHREKIINWFNRKRNKQEIKKTTIQKQWKKLVKPDEETYEIIMKSICDWNESRNIWCLKSGISKKKKRQT